MRISDWSSDVCSSDLKVKEETGAPFPQEPKDQVWAAIGAVFGSWMNQRAITYRRLHSITAEWGTAVNLQAMVFGNMGDDCATGAAFTRDPSTGDTDIDRKSVVAGKIGSAGVDLGCVRIV